MSLKSTIKSELADVEGVERAIAKTLHRHWALYLFEGIVLAVLDGIAILVPPLAMFAVTILLGWVFLISGVIGLSPPSGCGRDLALGGRLRRRSSASWPG